MVPSVCMSNVIFCCAIGIFSMSLALYFLVVLGVEKKVE